MRFGTLVLGSSLALSLATPLPASAVTLPMNSHETFLRVDPTDIASGARIIALGDYGLLPGHTIRIRPLGDFDNGPQGDEFSTMVAVLSASATLLDGSLQFRVPDAVDAGRVANTPGTCPSNVPTNIPSDFHVTAAGVDVTIPAGATHLFVMTGDCYFVDNSDPDGDYAVEITILTTGVGDLSVPGPPLMAPTPNPARENTTLSFSLPAAGRVTLAVHSLDGRRVRALVEGERGAGRHFAAWDGRDDAGDRLPAGIYFARLVTARSTVERKIALVR